MDKAIRSAKLTAAGILDKARARTAVTRAGGQIAPSKYLPNVPRQVHADGGKVAFQEGNHPDVPDVLYHGNAPKIATKGWTDEVDEEQTQKNIAAQDFRTFRPSDYGSYGAGIYLSDSPKLASDFAQGIRAEQTDAKPHGQVMKLHVSMKQPFTDDTLRHPAWRDHIKDAIKQGLWLGGINDEDKARAAELVEKLDGGTATVRDLFLTDTQHGAMVNQFGQQNIHKTIRNSGFDGIIAHRPDGSKEYVAFKPEQVKSAIGNQGTFDPNDPDITKAEGGAATALMFQSIHPELQGQGGAPLDLYHGTGQDKEFEAFDNAKLGARDAGFYGRGHYLTPIKGNAEGYADPDEMGKGTVIGPLHAALKNPYVWDVSNDMKAHSTLRDLQAMGIMREKDELNPWDNLQQHHIQPFMAEMQKRGHDGVIVKTQDHEGDQPSRVSEVVAFNPNTIKHKDAEVFDPSDPRIRREDGGSVTDTDEFRNWFGNSVTHTDGDPHVFYTGTSKDKDFTSHNVGRHGAWFTRDPAEASQYAEQNDSQGYKHEAGWKLTPTNTAGRVIPAYVKAENPYTGDLPDEVLRSNYKAAQSDWFDTLRRKGHDAWVPARYNGDLVVALKEPQQIKSIFNNGKFDPNQKHMNKAEGGTVDDTETQAPAARLGNGPQAGGFPIAGGVRGSESVFPAPLSPHGEVDLQGLPKDILIPKLGMRVTAGHNPVIRQVARDYTQTSGIDYRPPTIYQKVDPKRATRIADAYEEMAHNPDHPLVKASYEALKQETLDQYRAAKAAGLKMEFYPDVKKDPYHSQPRLMSEDVNKNNHMYVYPTDAGFGTGPQPENHENNPLLGDSGERWNGKPVAFNDLFRAVHDYYGHVKEGLGFRGDGEENAWRSHSAMYSSLARIALGAETRGQNSLLNYGPNGEHNRNASTEDTIFSPQKLGILPVWAHHEGAEFIKPEERDQMEAIYKKFGVGPEGVVGPDIRKPMSIFPKPQRMFPEDQRPAGGQYLSAHDKADVTGHKAEAATIGVAPGGKPFFHASQNAVEQTGTPGRGSATVKTNLFKQKAGWKWQEAPEGHEKTDTIVSVEHRGKHIYALNTHFPRGVDLARYADATSEPRLRPTTKGNVTLGPQAGSISVRGKVHPVYHHVIVKADGGAVDDALALTRRFTKDGKAATMALKSKGK